MNNYKSGKIAELYARMFLRFKGYTILRKNYKTGRGMNIGEVDFIAKKGNMIAFVEVKKRKTVADAAYALSKNQKRRIIRGAELFLKQFPQYRNFDIRFDVVLIAFPFAISHLKNAWMCEPVN